jgi:hypothetical protein
MIASHKVKVILRCCSYYIIKMVEFLYYKYVGYFITDLDEGYVVI